jgi:hypothetical protein
MPMNRTNHPSFIAKPQAPASRMKSKSRKGLGGDMSEAGTKTRRSFIAKPTRKKFLQS